ncbi:MAG: PAS domain S-box protein [Candidatus Obscuribacterales bacterium]|nr:PAS domain S-box protein [Candidatus Obscuribacterales bacterium]
MKKAKKHIQPHGFLIVTDLSLKIVQVSANIEDFLNVESTAFIGAFFLDRVNFSDPDVLDEIRASAGSVPETYRVQLLITELERLDCWITCHRSADFLIFEFERTIHTSSALGLKLVSEAVARFRSCANLEELLDQLARSLRVITDYDRVLVYKFDQGFNSQVLAESKQAELESSLLYMHFPSSVIPDETRELYLNNFLRIIGDVDYEPVPMRGARGVKVDLGKCILRAAAPSHIQYLKELEVRSSLFLSIVIKGELWGLVSCYNYSIKRPAHRVREACISLSHLAAASIEYLVSNEEKDLIARLDDGLYHLTNIINSSLMPVAELIELNRNDFASFIASSGFAVVDGGSVHNYLTTLKKDQIRELRNWLSEQKTEGVYCTSELSKEFDGAAAYNDHAAGVLAISPVSDNSQWVFWFRPAIGSAGDTAVDAEPLWKDGMKSSRPFNAIEIQFAEKLKDRLMKHTLAGAQKDKETLEAHREFLASIVDSSKDGIIGFSSHSEIISWNRGAADMFQMGADETIGQPLSSIFGEDDELFSLVSVDPSETIEKTIVRKDGQTLELSMKIYPIVTSETNPIFGAAIIRDVTAQKQAERELLLMSQQLVETNRQLEEYAWVAAHDLKEPVRTMGTYARLVLHDYGDRLDDDGLHMLDTIYSSASSAMNRIDDILSYSSLGRREFVATKISLAEILNRVMSDLGQAIRESGVKIIYTQLPEILGNGDMLALLFQNLISNAIKFRSKKPPTIKIEADRHDTHVLVKVSDNGIGIDMKYRDTIFGMFKRLDHKYPGTGLGLSIVRRIVELHNGRIWLESEPQKGTTFYIEFKAPI